MMTCAVKFSMPVTGLFFASDATKPTPDVLDSDVRDVEPDVSPGFASDSASW